MPQRSTNLLNKTIYGVGQAGNAAPPDSLSVRLTGLQKGTYVVLHGIAWGVTSATEAALAALDFGQLQIIRNEVFDAAFLYGGENVGDTKDVIFHDNITTQERFRYRDFAEPWRLDEAQDYLIVMAAPIDLSAAGQLYNCALTVRGEIVGTAPKIGEKEER